MADIVRAGFTSSRRSTPTLNVAEFLPAGLFVAVGAGAAMPLAGRALLAGLIGALGVQVLVLRPRLGRAARQLSPGNP